MFIVLVVCCEVDILVLAIDPTIDAGRIKNGVVVVKHVAAVNHVELRVGHGQELRILLIVTPRVKDCEVVGLFAVLACLELGTF